MMIERIIVGVVLILLAIKVLDNSIKIAKLEEEKKREQK